MRGLRRRTKLLLVGLAFGISVATVIALASGSPQLGLHGSVWITLAFMLWLEWRWP
ncbi:MAG: hypothetical protein MUC96_07590 [Myxococcaceae bacterium]|jgi:hypothetical protein|nr:hypothetical protein [Myxococcaceae bacterium]